MSNFFVHRCALKVAFIRSTLETLQLSSIGAANDMIVEQGSSQVDHHYCIYAPSTIPVGTYTPCLSVLLLLYTICLPHLTSTENKYLHYRRQCIMVPVPTYNIISYLSIVSFIPDYSCLPFTQYCSIYQFQREG